MSQGAGAFLGLSDPADGPDSATNIWLQRRAAFHGGSLLMGRNVSKKCREQLEQDDSHAPTPTPRDPLHRPGKLAHNKGVIRLNYRYLSAV